MRNLCWIVGQCVLKPISVHSSKSFGIRRLLKHIFLPFVNTLLMNSSNPIFVIHYLDPRVHGGIILKWILHSNEPSGTIKGSEFLDTLSYRQLWRKTLLYVVSYVYPVALHKILHAENTKLSLLHLPVYKFKVILKARSRRMNLKRHQTLPFIRASVPHRLHSECVMMNTRRWAQRLWMYTAAT